jgi:hypothetical protein
MAGRLEISAGPLLVDIAPRWYGSWDGLPLAM